MVVTLVEICICFPPSLIHILFDPDLSFTRLHTHIFTFMFVRFFIWFDCECCFGLWKSTIKSIYTQIHAFMWSNVNFMVCERSNLITWCPLNLILFKTCAMVEIFSSAHLNFQTLERERARARFFCCFCCYLINYTKKLL